jgi:hypothetical protein
MRAWKSIQNTFVTKWVSVYGVATNTETTVCALGILFTEATRYYAEGLHANLLDKPYSPGDL